MSPKNRKFVMIFDWNHIPMEVRISRNLDNKNAMHREYKPTQASMGRLNSLIPFHNHVDIIPFTTISFFYPQ